ncbi:outer membrane lipoprotein-sorting protein [Reinekea thalattae]|uniref:Outer membrane lipoprotein-sorting protein n=1 Tax=Reinekea thalattae TaxID=2593301 RepID=A0A5C8ZA98_9GAMM|nr:outer membrane lipoprotein-sorting protein [Reinekea thalattae]TXR54882.1 outer membrane lipoprotein-sorting protein [Reinekea thalattae]
MKKFILILGLAIFPFSPAYSDVGVDEVMNNFAEVIRFPMLSGTFNVKMIAQNGDTREVRARAYQKVMSAEQLNLLFKFEYPPTVRDTSLLIHTYFNGDPSQMWIYLPAVRRIKRVALEESGGGYFMGSDFTYADLIMRTDADYTKEIIGEKEIEGKLSYMVKDTAVNDELTQLSGYSYTINYYSKDDFFLYGRDYYDLQGDLLKTYRVKDVFKVDERIYPIHLVMHNVQSEHTSIIEVEDYSVDDIPDSYFTTRSLRSE